MYAFYWRRQWHPIPVLLPGKSHGWRSLVGCSPWGHWGLDMTERLHFHFSLLCIGEGNGNPLQCSCLENPRDGGAWWAAVYGVTQSWTQLKWLSNMHFIHTCICTYVCSHMHIFFFSCYHVIIASSMLGIRTASPLGSLSLVALALTHLFHLRQVDLP